MLFGLCTARVGWGAVEQVDTRDALVIGSYTVSAYRVAKSYRRSLSPATPPEKRAPTSEAARAWFARFLADQVITAKALEEGYGERPEVTSEVRRMERHMLTQAAGPYYQRLYSSKRAPGHALEAAVSSVRSSRYEIDVVRVPKAAPEARRLNAGFDLSPPDEQESALMALNESGQAQGFSGTMEWPFAPFEEIGSVIKDVAVGRWHKLDAGDDLIAFRVRRVHPIVLPAGVPLSPPAPELLEHMEHERIRREHARQVLSEAQLAFDWGAAARWVARLAAQNPDSLLPLDLAAAGELRDIPIASYREGEGDRSITVADYIGYYNDSYIRYFPRRAVDLYRAVQAMIVARRDEQEARGLEIDREPKFTEDRCNYRAQLALELFVRERVRPALGISEDDIARHYAANQPAFARPTEIEGTLVTFARIDDASAFARAADVDASCAPPEHAEARATISLTPTTELPAFPFLPRIVFSEQAPRVVGPFPDGGSFGVWVRGRITASQTLPLSAVSREIRAQLEQPRLEARLANLARELCRGVPIEDRIAYAQYGVTDFVAKPWSTE